MKENRKTLRFDCQEELFFQLDGKSHDAKVLDISRGGVRVASDTKVAVGRNLFLRIKDKSRGRVPVKAVVRWRSGGSGGPYEYGLEFRESASKLGKRWVRKLFPEEGRAWTVGYQQRSEIRVPAYLPVVVAGGYAEGKIVDISSSGAKLVLEQKIEGTTGLYLCLPWDFVEVRANVLRSEQQECNWIHSVRFSPMSEDESDQLKGFVEHAIS